MEWVTGIVREWLLLSPLPSVMRAELKQLPFLDVCYDVRKHCCSAGRSCSAFCNALGREPGHLWYCPEHPWFSCGQYPRVIEFTVSASFFNKKTGFPNLLAFPNCFAMPISTTNTLREGVLQDRCEVLTMRGLFKRNLCYGKAFWKELCGNVFIVMWTWYQEMWYICDLSELKSLKTWEQNCLLKYFKSVVLTSFESIC